MLYSLTGCCRGAYQLYEVLYASVPHGVTAAAADLVLIRVDLRVPRHEIGPWVSRHVAEHGNYVQSPSSAS